jgi:hypothetical protein
MRKLIFLLALFALTSCDDHQGMGAVNETNTAGFEADYRVVVIDSCEYIIYDIHKAYVGYGYMAHKGNCKFCAERNKQ